MKYGKTAKEREKELSAALGCGDVPEPSKDIKEAYAWNRQKYMHEPTAVFRCPSCNTVVDAFEDEYNLDECCFCGQRVKLNFKRIIRRR